MSIELLRIDDRLVHGQVIEGWVRTMRISHLIVASDTIAQDETQKALYYLAVPQGVELSCLTIQETAEAWMSGSWKQDKTLVLVASAQEALALAEAGAPLKSVNVGGIHFKEGRVQVLKAISLDESDVEALQKLIREGVILEARPLPLDEPINLKEYLDRWAPVGDQPR
jgi:mannose/fructose/N-acetylgalactosamine-specific phosphotransferase system component IIB